MSVARTGVFQSKFLFVNQSFGAFLLALALLSTPVTGWSDHSMHDHDILNSFAGVDRPGYATLSGNRQAPARTPEAMATGRNLQMAGVTVPSERALNDAALNSVRSFLDARHGGEEMDHRTAHGDLNHASVDALERSMTRSAGEPIMLAQAQVGNATGTADQIGRWSSVINMPVVPIFTALLPNGKVLMWDSVGDAPTESFSTHNFTRGAVWDPITNTSIRIDVSGFNIFCAGFAHMPDGRVFVAGGNKDSSLNGIRQTHTFDFNSNTWARGPDMFYERWYPSVAALSNGEHFVMAGGPDVHEVRQLDNTMRYLPGAVIAHSRDYPFIQTGLDGRVIYAGPQDQLRLIDTNGTGSVQNLGSRDGVYRSYGSYAMYDIGKMIVTGGAGSTNSATLLQMTGNSITAAAASSMVFGRRQHNATMLADGSVLVTGGLSSGAGLVDLTAGVYAAEIWQPATRQWKELASAAKTRQYHSVALLLPDGRVFTGGGGICGACQQAGYLEKNGEIFSPPYLFRKDGSGELASRPTISSVQAAVDYGQVFDIASPQAQAISKVGLVRLGAATHSQDQGQRYIPLVYSASAGLLTATGPANANIAPPGYYMLFVIDTEGVPSVAKMVQIADSITPPPPFPPPTGSGTGLTGQYFNNKTLSGTAVLQRTEAVNFNWGSGSPGPGVGVDNFSARWVGQVEAPSTGSYQFQTRSDDGVRLWVNGQQLINNWTDHAPTTNTSSPINLNAGTKSNITVEFYENSGGATVSLSWKLPNSASFNIIPIDRLYPGTPPSPPPPPPSGSFASTLVARHSGQCLDVPGSSTSQGAQLQQYSCNGTNAQLFDFAPVPGKTNVFAITNRNSRLCLDIADASQTNGARLIQWSCRGGTNQQFLLSAVTTAGAKAFRLRPVHSNKCVEVAGASQTSQAKVQQGSCSSGNHQIWTISGKP